MGRRRKLQRHEIGEGFFDDLLTQARAAVHKHAEITKVKHMAALKKHLKTGVTQLHAADSKADMQKIKTDLVAKGKAQLHEIAEEGKAKAQEHVERIKKKAVARVRSRVCGEVGEGFFSNLFKGVTSFVGRMFGAGKTHATNAITQGVQAVKKKIQDAPGIIKAHVVKHKDAYIKTAIDGATDVLENGKEGVTRQIGKARTGMVKKARSVAGCEGREAGSGLRRRRKPKGRAKGSGGFEGASAEEKREAIRDAWLNYKKTEGSPKKRKTGGQVGWTGRRTGATRSRRGRGMRMAGGLEFKGSGLRIVG